MDKEKIVKLLTEIKDNNYKEVIETLQYMINFYEEEEMYEHCGNLLKMANAFANVEDFKPIILWIRDLIRLSPENLFIFELHLIYINSSTSKILFDICKPLIYD